MKHYINFTCTFLFLCIIFSYVKAEEHYYIGAAGGDWNGTNNWSYASGGSNNGLIPDPNDTVYIPRTISLSANTEINTVFFTGAEAINITGGFDLSITGNLHVSNMNANNYNLVSDHLVFSGTGDQLIEGLPVGNSNHRCYLQNIIVNKPSGTLFFKDMVNVKGDLELIQGSVDLETYFAQFTIARSSVITGNWDFYELYVGSNYQQVITVSSNSIVNVIKKLTFEKGGSLSLNGNQGSFNIQGDFFAKNMNNLSGGIGTLALTFNGATDQLVEGLPYNQLTSRGLVQDIVVDKNSGILYFKDRINLKNGIQILNGSIDALTLGSEVSFNGSATLAGNMELDKVNIGANSTLNMHIDANSTLVVKDDFTFLKGGSIFLYGPGEIHIQGDLFAKNIRSWTANIGDAVLLINGNADQLIEGLTPNNHRFRGFLQDIVIDKPSGITFFKDNINLKGSLTVLNGQTDFITHSSKVSFFYDAVLTGQMAFYDLYVSAKYNLDFTVPLGSNITVKNKMFTDYNAQINYFGEGEFAIEGDFDNLNTSYYGGQGDMTMVFTGSSNQTLKGNSIQNRGWLPTLQVNKTSGNVTIDQNVGVKGDWLVENGDIVQNPNSSIMLQGTDKILKAGVGVVYDKIGFMFTNTQQGNRQLIGDLVVAGELQLGNGIVDLNGYSVYIENSDPNAITYHTHYGLLRNNTKDLDAKIYWKVDNNLGLFSFSFPNGNISNYNNDYSFDITSAGVTEPGKTGYVAFTTYETDATNQPMPLGLRDILDANGTDNTLNIGDAFFTYDFVNYTSNPDGVFRFSYDKLFLSPNTPNEILNTIEYFNDGIWTTDTPSNINTPGNYVEFAGLSDHEIMVLTRSDKPSASSKLALNVIANMTNIGFVDQADGIIDLIVTGGTAPYAYSWSSGATTSSINLLLPGDYDVTVTDADGVSINAEFSIDYDVFARGTEAFIQDENGRLIKHSDAYLDDELLLASVGISKDGNGWSEISFSAKDSTQNDSLLFYFGFDLDPENSSGELLSYGVKCVDNNLWIISNSKTLDYVGSYKSGEPLLALQKGQKLEFYLSGKMLYAFNVDGNQDFYPKSGFGHSTSLKKWIGHKFWNAIGETDHYATLTKKLDAGYYVMTNDIKLKYKEKYNDDFLDYKVYDWEREVVMANVQPEGGHQYGVQYHSISTAYNYLSDEEFYVMEVTNDKGEMYKMRFQFKKVGEFDLIVIPDPPGPVEPPYSFDACCYPKLKKCCGASSNPPFTVSTGVISISANNNNTLYKIP